MSKTEVFIPFPFKDRIWPNSRNKFSNRFFWFTADAPNRPRLISRLGVNHANNIILKVTRDLEAAAIRTLFVSNRMDHHDSDLFVDDLAFFIDDWTTRTPLGRALRKRAEARDQI